MKITKTQDKFRQMTEGNVYSLVLKMAIPTIITMLITAIYNMADTYFVGQLGDSATGAVGVVFSLMSVIQAIGFFFGHGSGNFMSRKLGEKKMKEAETMAASGFVYGLIFGVALTTVCLIFTAPICDFLGSTKTILPHAVDYMRFIALAIPFMIGAFILNNQLRFQGNATIGMICMTTGGILNIGLDPLFINVFNMGVGGAGFATMVSQMISFVMLIFGSAKFSTVKLSLKNVQFKLRWVKEIFKGGLPSLARQGLNSVSTIILNNVCKPYGDPVIAAVSVVTKVTMMIASALIGLGQGFQPVCGYNYGARKFKRVTKAFWFSTILGTVLLGLAAVAVYIFSPQIIALFRADSPRVIEVGSTMLRFHAIVFPISSFTIMANMMLQTMGRTVPATIVAMARHFLCMLPVLFLLEALLGLLGIQLTQMVADILAFLLAVPFTVRELVRLKRLDKEADGAGSAGANPPART